MLRHHLHSAPCFPNVKQAINSSPYQSSPLSGPCTRKRKPLRVLTLSGQAGQPDGGIVNQRERKEITCWNWLAKGERLQASIICWTCLGFWFLVTGLFLLWDLLLLVMNTSNRLRHQGPVKRHLVIGQRLRAKGLCFT
jgi:hypothetical protein